MPLHTPFLKDYQDHKADGTNSFTYSRFLVPYLQGFQGFAIFADGADMLCRADIAELWDMRDPLKAVQVVKHDYTTCEPRKYVGTQMEAPNSSYPRKNWSSLMLFNCSYPMHNRLTPQYIAQTSGTLLHRLSWLDDSKIGELPKEWNWLDEYGRNDQS
ncbi:MAG: hypothetical protein RIS80_1046, partial [Actinomycetota bacterium]